MDDPKFHITPFQQAAASLSGAIITSLFVTPLDVVKIRLQAQQKKASKCFLYCNGLMDHLCGCTPETAPKEWFQKPGHFNGTIDAFVKISKHEGILALWSGLAPTLVLAIPTTILYFVSYEQLRSKIRKWHIEKVGKDSEQPYWIPLIAGATARVTAVSTVSPLELIRTKMQSQRLSYFELGETLKNLVQQDGIKGLWKGVFPTLYRDVPFSAVYWMNYEKIKTLFSKDTPIFWVSFFSGAVAGGLAATVTVPFDVVKTHQQIEIGEKTLYTNTPKRPKSTLQVIRDIYQTNGHRGLFAGLVPRLIKVAPACAIMISTFEYGKVFFYRYNETMLDMGELYDERVDFYYDNFYPPDHY